MHYPWWYVPVLTAPMLIAIIAVVHVLVSHYAVGGGILIALENQFALKTGDTLYRDYWKKHAQFFVLITVAFGAITGVGIWWTIGLASPLATELLIRTFVFGWAIEWVFFIVEIVAAFVMYYFWTRLPAKTHIAIAWIYAIAAWISLVLITGITGFMLDSRGMIANWSETGNFWHAFLNIQFVPQTIIRTGASVLLAGLYVFVHAAWTFRQADRDHEQSDLLEKIVRRMAKPMIFGAVTMTAGFAFFFVTLSPRVLLAMERAAALNIILTIAFALSVVIALLVFFGPMLHPRSVNLGFAVCLFIFGLTAFAAAEFVREAVRKPWIVDQVVLGNQILADEVSQRQKSGFLTTDHLVGERQETGGGREEEGYKQVAWARIPLNDSVRKGGMVFMYHCNNCHALEQGLSSISTLLVGEDKEQIMQSVRRLNEPTLSMPPWCGTEDELDDLAEFLLTIRRESP